MLAISDRPRTIPRTPRTASSSPAFVVLSVSPRRPFLFACLSSPSLRFCSRPRSRPRHRPDPDPDTRLCARVFVRFFSPPGFDLRLFSRFGVPSPFRRFLFSRLFRPCWFRFGRVAFSAVFVVLFGRVASSRRVGLLCRRFACSPFAVSVLRPPFRFFFFRFSVFVWRFFFVRRSLPSRWLAAVSLRPEEVEEELKEELAEDKASRRYE